MSDKEILTRAIQKAIESGWKPSGELGSWVYKTGFIKEEQYGYIYDMVGLRDLIFSHGFARSLWGESFIETGLLYKPSKPDASLVIQQMKAWQFHLQQLVVADDPIEYLGEHI